MKYTPLQHLTLQAGASYVRPPELPRVIHPDDPACDVMTDFTHIHPVTIKGQVPIDDALERMKSAGVRLLLVTDDDECIVGLVTSADIQGERPVEIVQEQRIPRSAISVEMIMRTQPGIAVLDLAQVQKVQVGHIIETLKKLERQHVLVVETEPRQTVVGLFSLSQIRKQLHRGIVDNDTHFPTVAELVHELRAEPEQHL